MLRVIVLTASLLAAGSVPALSQTHDRSHDRTRPHGPGHVVPDSAMHAAMHALVHGTWAGTLSSHEHGTNDVDLSIAHDSAQRMTLTFHSTHSIGLGVAKDVVVRGDTLQWTQAISGKACKARALLITASERSTSTMKGRMSCDRHELTFEMHKKAE